MLPGFKNNEVQSRLWDELLGNHGHCRTVLGDFAESLTAKILRGRRYRTDSRSEYCPDVFALGAWFEVKAAGRTNQTFVYAGRLAKDRTFSASRQLYYVIWHHAAETRTCRTKDDLRRLFLSSLKCIYVVEFAEIDAIAATIPATRLNSKYGHSDSNPTYGSGYRIPLSRVVARPHLTLSIAHERQGVLFA